MDHLRLFTPGPVPIEQHIRDIGKRQPLYNRTQSFSALTHEVLSGLQHVFQTEGHRPDLWCWLFGVGQITIAFIRLIERGKQLVSNPEGLTYPLRK